MNSTSENKHSQVLADIRKWAKENLDQIFLSVTVNKVSILLDKYQIDSQETDEDLMKLLIERSKHN